jgi:hypothetical protein
MTAVRSRRNARLKKLTRPGLPQERRQTVFFARQAGAAGDVRASHENDNVSGFALRHGRYETLGTFYRVSIDGAGEVRIVHRTVTIIDGWFDDDVFYRSHIRTIERVRGLWRCIKRPTHPYFDSHDPEDRQDGVDAERAKNVLRNCRRLVGDYRWNIFENVARWNEPTGVPGSRIARVSPASIAAAQEIVRDVADDIWRAQIL